MIAGHFALAAAVKSRAKDVPLWSLMLATAWMDVIFVPLLAAHIETIHPVDHGGYGGVVIHADWTHSLIGALAIAASFGAVFAVLWNRRAGLVLGAVVFSHWLLDLPMHRGDMPILPGAFGHLPLLGFGLWRSPAASALLELAMVIVGALLYYRAATEIDHGSRRSRVLGASVALTLVATLVLNVLGM